MATLVLTAVGTALGGPIGGAIGAFVGQQADRAIFGGGSREGPRLKELSVTTSSYGQPIPRQFGRMRVAGTVIWSTELIETTTKEGGGKGRPSTKTYSYSASFAVALSSTPLSRIGRIWADGNLLRGAGGDLKAAGAMRTYLGLGDAPVDPLIAADKGASSPAFRDCAYVVFEDLQLADFGNRIPALTFEVFGPEDSSVSLGQLVPAISASASDVALQHARGFSDEGAAIGSSLAAISRVFPLNCVTTPTGLSLTSATALPAVVPTLPPQLSATSSEGADERHHRRGSRSGGEPLALRYYDEQRDYQPGVQRAHGMRPDGREAMVDLPATMTAGGARQLANSNAHRGRWRDEHVTWRIGELNAEICAGKVVRLPDKDGYWTIRSWEWFDRGIELSLERFAPELGAASQSDAGVANIPLDLTVGPTILDFFEVPPLDGSNPVNPSIFAAASSSGAGWRGASLLVEQAGTLKIVGSTGTRRAVAGTLATPLDASLSTLLQPSGTIQISVHGDDLGFDSTDVTGLALGANRLLVGGEVVQFLQAAPLGANQWRLEGLLRGRAGTEHAAAAGHAAGTSAVLLDDRLTRLDGTQVPAIAGTRIAAIGRGDPVPVYAEIANVGLSRRPPVPVAPRRLTEPNGDLTWCWTRRARGHWRWPESSEVPLMEEQESYAVGYGSTSSPLAVWSVSQPQFTLSVAQRADLLAQHGSRQLWVRQLGTFGQSQPLLLATIT
ncbi:MAG: phage tail protein [Erythrobacter sp.]